MAFLPSSTRKRDAQQVRAAQEKQKARADDQWNRRREYLEQTGQLERALTEFSDLSPVLRSVRAPRSGGRRV